MKRFAILLFFLSLLQPVLSQKFMPLLYPWRVWAELDEYSNWAFTTTYYKISGDTVINTMNYNKVSHCYNNPNMNSWDEEHYFVRETSDNEIFRYSNGNETLMYDFNLEAGDSLFIYTNHVGQDIYAGVASVDSVFLNNSYRKRINFDSWTNETWIEGIGSLTTPFYPFKNLFTSDLDYSVLCVHDADILVYHNPDYDTCYIMVVGINELSQSHLSVFPNPSSAKITVETSELSSKGQLTILNLGSQPLMQQEITEAKTTLDVSQLSPGIYVVKLVGEKKVMIGKFVKQ